MAKRMKGKFSLTDLEAILSNGKVFDQEAFTTMTRKFPSKWAVSRFFRGQEKSRKVPYVGPVVLIFTGYYDKSGEDISLIGNKKYIPNYTRKLLFNESLMWDIAQEKGIDFEDGEFYVPRPINDMRDLAEGIKAIKETERELTKVVESIVKRTVKRYRSFLKE